MLNFLKRWWPAAVIAMMPLQRIPSIDAHLGARSITLRLSILVALIGFGLYGRTVLSKIRFSWLSPYTWLVAYLAVTFISFLESIDKPRSAVALVATVLTIGTGIILSVVVRAKDLPLLRKTLFITSVVVSIFGLYQFFGDSLGLPYWLTGLRPNYVKAVFGFPRIQSTLLEPLFFANFLLLPILLSVALVYARVLHGWKMFALIFLLALDLTLTLSRGGIVGAVIGLAVVYVALWRLTELKTVTYTSLSIVAAALFALGLIYTISSITASTKAGDRAVKSYVKQSTKLESTTTSADSDRVVNKGLAKRAFMSRPVLGYGVGSFGSYARQTYPSMYNAKTNSPTVNNEYYEILAETGILGALTLFGFVATLFFRVIKAWRGAVNPANRAWLVALTATGIAYGVQYYAFSTLYIVHIWVTVGLLLAVVSPSFGKVVEEKPA